MKIALYSSHHHLPFWHPSQQPKELFDPAIHGIREFTFEKHTQQVVESWIWPVLMGLYAIDISVLAHVSAFCDCEIPGTWHHAHRTWVQITTLPTDVNDAGIPITMKDDRVIVNYLWGGDNGTYTPYELLDGCKQEASLENGHPKFWHDFFVGRLKANKIAAEKEAHLAARKAEAIRNRYSLIPS